MRSLCFVVGTRPEIIKLAPVFRRARARSIPFTLIHTGQHYDYSLDRIFFDELELPTPTNQFSAASSTQGGLFAQLFLALERLWMKEPPSVVVVQGDTNTTFAAAFCGQRLGIPVAHVEAGLRSDDWTMPEEANRVLTDHLASRLYAPTEQQAWRLRREGIPEENILVTGNTVVDAVRDNTDKAGRVELTRELAAICQEPFAVITLHRPGLVDDSRKLHRTLNAIEAVLECESLRGLFLMHPRTEKALAPDCHRFKAVVFHKPVGYLTMLSLLGKARIVLTDSGGLQEECAILRVPCLTLRENTERPETLAAGGNRLVGFDTVILKAAVAAFLHKPIPRPSLYERSTPSVDILRDLSEHYLHDGDRGTGEQSHDLRNIGPKSSLLIDT